MAPRYGQRGVAWVRGAKGIVQTKLREDNNGRNEWRSSGQHGVERISASEVDGVARFCVGDGGSDRGEKG